LTIEKDAGTEVTLGQNLTIENYWYINSGDMVAGADITLNGHLTRESGAGFDPGLFEVEFGGYFDNTVTDNDSNILPFYDLTVNKPTSGNVILAFQSPIEITNELFSITQTRVKLMRGLSMMILIGIMLSWVKVAVF
jgi:hypothetical protein